MIKLHRQIRLFLPSVIVVALLAAIPGPGRLADAAAKPFAPPSHPDLLSFTAGGHVLGFQPTGVYVADGDRLLKVDFKGTPGGAPVSHSDQDRLGLRDRVGLDGAPSLGTVTYPDLCPGVSLTYQAQAGGIAKSTYLVAPGGKVGDIRLRYNVPVEVAEDGSLVFAFATGEMRESAPVAWQEIAGERIPVEVAF